MTHAATRILTVALAATLSTAAAAAQAISNPSGAATPTNVARVYVQTAKGVNVYTTSSVGKLTLVSGSPFKNTAGMMIGFAGSHLITVGTNYVHAYAIKSTGGIGGQVAQINSALHPGADCGSTDGGTIDRTGTEAYIQFQFLGPYDEGCDAVQSYKIAATGAFTFGGVAQFYGEYNEELGGPLVVAGNNGHAYTFPMYRSENQFAAFYRDRFGAMNDATETTFTYPPPNGGVYFPIAMAPDNQNVPASHMAVALHEDFGEPCGGSTAPVLASYTIAYNGNLSYSGGALIKTAINPALMAINPQGNLLAVGAAGSYGCYTKDGPGLQIFHFNGAKPITAYSSILTKNPIDSIAWDKSNHLYATSHVTNKLYVFTITPTSITPVAGSPFTLSGPSTVVVGPL